MGRRWVSLCMVLGALVAPLRASQPWTPEKWFAQPKSPRIANYRIEAALDWEQKSLAGKETLTWRNAGTAPTDEFPLHLYLNAFKGPKSLFVKESGGRLRGDRLANAGASGSWGYCRMASVEAGGQALAWHYGEDETVAWVRLPRAVRPGETIAVTIAWESRFPKVFARSGWGNGPDPKQANFLMGGQWFPKVGVYQGDRWNCHAYHANTEFFSDFGTYDVALSLGNRLSLAHTGTQVNFKDAGDVEPDPKRPHHVIWKLHAEDVHDFSFAVMPSASWKFLRKDYRGVQVFYFYQPENFENLKRQQDATEWALRLSGEWYFPYPYPVLTVVDVPKEASGADGMEYPTLITASSTRFDPFRARVEPEVVTVHEFGHQYFYGMLASNEFEEPWMDEGFNSWFTHKAMQRAYQGLLTSRRFFVDSAMLEFAGHWSDPSVDPLTRFGFLVRDNGSYFRAAYAKPTMVLDQLEASLGRPVMERVLRAYTQEMAFKHPTRGDFKRIAERVSGRDLGAFWRDHVEGTDVLDYAIHAVKTVEVTEGGWVETEKGMSFVSPQPRAPGRRGTITLARKGGLVAPITLWVRLENKEEQRLTWDGRDRWVTYEFDAPISQAVLDPDGNYPLLKDRFHAHYAQKTARRGFHYWSQLVWGTVATFLQGCGIG